VGVKEKNKKTEKKEGRSIRHQMTEIAMDQRRDQDTEEVVGIAWGDPEPAE